MTVVQLGLATKDDRTRALSRERAHDVLYQLYHGGDSEGRRHTLCEIHRIATGDTGIAYWRINTATLAEQVLAAVSRGSVLVVEGWFMGNSWTSSSVRHTGPDESGDIAPSRADARLARRIMGDRGEISFEGSEYILLPASSWSEMRNRGEVTVVGQEEAAAILQRMAGRASSDGKAAIIEAARILSQTKGRIVGRGLVLVRVRGPEQPSASAKVDEPLTSSAPPARRAEPKERLKGGTLALVFDILTEEDHDKPVLFVLEAHDGSFKETLYVTDDKVVAHDRIELRWHDLPEDLRYSLHLKQADGDVEVLFENVPFVELSGHTDYREAAYPHAPVEDEP